jgi:hypothetical protein
MSMSRTTQDPIAVAKMAVEAGRRALPEYSCPKSPQKFTQPQLFAMLVLKQFFKRDYRGTVAWLSKWSELRSALGITKVPHYRTLHEAARRLLKKGAECGFWMPPSNSPASVNS